MADDLRGRWSTVRAGDRLLLVDGEWVAARVRERLVVWQSVSNPLGRLAFCAAILAHSQWRAAWQEPKRRSTAG